MSFQFKLLNKLPNDSDMSGKDIKYQIIQISSILYIHLCDNRSRENFEDYFTIVLEKI